MQKELLYRNQTPEELLEQLGQHFRTLRLRQNLDQQTVAERAGISLSALKNLETGRGATLTTLVKTLRVLGLLDWLESLAPSVSVSPLQVLKSKSERRRASKPRPRRTTPAAGSNSPHKDEP
ncbi:MAG: helix-turn-helix transcriptional regulator [Meiothermus sp.]|nr:helix-turn-helix transcriptional regulator [Meiothermus sp.]